jgi:hypothetical protein
MQNMTTAIEHKDNPRLYPPAGLGNFKERKKEKLK